MNVSIALAELAVPLFKIKSTTRHLAFQRTRSQRHTNLRITKRALPRAMTDEPILHPALKGAEFWISRTNHPTCGCVIGPENFKLRRRRRRNRRARCGRCPIRLANRPGGEIPRIQKRVRAWIEEDFCGEPYVIR